MNKGVGLTMEVSIGKLANLREKSKKELIIRFTGEITRELLKRVTDQPRTHIQERLTEMDFEGFLEG
jgi:hypothetical protein